MFLVSTKYKRSLRAEKEGLSRSLELGWHGIGRCPRGHAIYCTGFVEGREGWTRPQLTTRGETTQTNHGARVVRPVCP